MVDIEKLREVIDDSGMKMSAIAEKSGIERTSLYYKLTPKGAASWRVTEMEGIAKTLRLTSAQKKKIFLT